MTKIVLLENQNQNGAGEGVEIPPCIMEIACSGNFDGAAISFEVQYQDNGNNFSGAFFKKLKPKAFQVDQPIKQTASGSLICFENNQAVKLRIVVENAGENTNITCFGFYQLRPNKNNINY